MAVPDGRSRCDARSLDSQWVSDVARRVVGANVVTCAPLKGFAGGSSFAISADDDRFVLKAEDAIAVHAEAWACRAARAAGAPAPVVVHVGEQDGRSFVLLRWMAGEPMEAPGMAVETAGAALRRTHEVEGQGFGWLFEGGTEDGEPRGAFTTWLDAVVAMSDTSRVEDAGLLPVGTGDRVRVAIDRRRNALEAVTTAHFLHGDVHLRHLLIYEENLVGIIDWGDAALGDPLFEFGRFRRCGRRALAQLAAGYGLDLDPEDAELIELYCCVWSLHALNLELGAGGDWFQQHVEAIERTLATLEATSA